MANSRKSLSTDSAAAVLQNAVEQCIARYVLPGQRIVVGVSGGIDSVSLLHVLARLVREGAAPWQLSAVHVHHGLSRNAERWSDFCGNICAQLMIPFRVARVEVKGIAETGLEAAARRARHGVFSSAEEEWVMLAHHRDDQAETLLFNLLRGTGIAGASAMRERNGRLLRPLLAIGRTEIESYARHQRLAWCDDESNADLGLSRNFLRRRVLPLLTERFPATSANFAKAATHFAESRELLDELACLDLGGALPDFPISIGTLAELTEPRQRNLLRYLLSLNNVQIPSEAKLREAVQQMVYAAQDRHPVIVFGQHCLRRCRGSIYLELLDECADSN